MNYPAKRIFNKLSLGLRVKRCLQKYVSPLKKAAIKDWCTFCLCTSDLASFGSGPGYSFGNVSEIFELTWEVLCTRSK